jgi:hypothetical protein
MIFMKRLALVLLATVVFSGCSRKTEPIDASQYPLLVVDAEHQIQGTNSPATYQFGATKGLRVDAARFQFRYGTSDVAPNMIQVVIGKSQLHMLSKATETNFYLIDRSTLKPLRGGQFSGFQTGDVGVIMIGRLMADPVEKVSVAVSWAAKYEVK